MKVPFARIEPLLKQPDPQFRVWLVYGPDGGLAAERAKTIGRHVCKDLSDPFNVVTLTGPQLADDPVKLNDEAFAQSLMGGNRLVFIRDAGDGLTPLLKEYLASPSAHTLVVVEAGELGPKSSLRLAAEKAPNAVTIPCYVEDERDLTRLIADRIKAEGYAIDRDAQAALASTLVGDHGTARSEIEKLLLYKMGDNDRTIRLADVLACSGDTRARTLDEMVHAFGTGDAARLAATLATLMEENTAPVAILRTIQNHLRRLNTVQILMSENGMDAGSAMKSLNPPVFFKFEEIFSRQVRAWPLKRLSRALQVINQTEAETKRTGIPAETLTAQVLMTLSLNLDRAAA